MSEQTDAPPDLTGEWIERLFALAREHMPAKHSYRLDWLQSTVDQGAIKPEHTVYYLRRWLDQAGQGEVVRAEAEKLKAKVVRVHEAWWREKDRDRLS